jgi:hypothetical protein
LAGSGGGRRFQRRGARWPCHGIPRRCRGIAETRRAGSRRDGQQLEEEDQRRPARDPTAAGAAGAISERRRDDDYPAAADAHGADGLVPAADHIPTAHAEGEGAASLVARIEGRTVVEEVAWMARSEARSANR